ncbi:MAG: nucleotidyltransferase domain-containing protein [Nitrospirota bacterium]|jgi:predicted nucleotidyltransferase
MDSVEKLKNFLDNDPNVIFALIFGSGATGKQKRGSDIDIGIYFVKPPEGLDLLDLINVLSELTGREVDVVALNNASALLRHQVMKNRVALTIKDMVIYRKFREKTISDYDEYKYVAGMNVYDR